MQLICRSSIYESWRRPQHRPRMGGLANVALVTYRGEWLENKHTANIAVTDSTGKLLFYFGDSNRMTLVRSTAKPMQTLAILESGVEKYGFTDQDLALMCASHNSEDRHIEQARAMLKTIGVDESKLQCGGHKPLSEEVYKNWIKHDFVPTGICNNCSGKHVGMIAAALEHNMEVDEYCDPNSSLQTKVKEVVARITGLDQSEVKWAIDGCNLPAPAFPLRNLAFAYSKFANAADSTASGESNDQEVERMARIFNAMSSNPHSVAGEGRFCTKLMEMFEGNVIAKLGADAIYAIGIRECEATRKLGAEGALGLAFKADDGNIDNLYSVICETLARLGLTTVQQQRELAEFHYPPMLNTMNIVAGKREFPFALRLI